MPGRAERRNEQAPLDLQGTVLLGCILVLGTLLIILAFTITWKDDLLAEENNARSRVLSLAMEMAQVAKGDGHIDVANNHARPFGLFYVGSRPSIRTIALSGHFDGRDLVVEAHRVTQAECRYFGRMLKGGEDPVGVFDGVSVNGSGFMEAGYFPKEACRPDTTARGTGLGLPENVVKIRIAAPRPHAPV